MIPAGDALANDPGGEKRSSRKDVGISCRRLRADPQDDLPMITVTTNRTMLLYEQPKCHD